MINYSKQAMRSYVDRIEGMQHKLSRIPLSVNGLELDEMYWLVHVALDDLKRVAMKEWDEPFDAGQEMFADLARELAG
jgi:hypothetical protein